MDMVWGRRKEPVRWMERAAWKFTHMYKRQPMGCAVRNSKRGSVITQRGGVGREMGERFTRESAYVYVRLIHTDIWQKTRKFCKAVILQFKKIKIN